MAATKCRPRAALALLRRLSRFVSPLTTNAPGLCADRDSLDLDQLPDQRASSSTQAASLAAPASITTRL